MPATASEPWLASSGRTRGRGWLWMAGRRTVRAAGLISAPLRPPPDFLLIGAKRGGTTSMYRYLLQHPHVLPMFPSARRLPMAEDPKGAHYFDTGYDHGAAWYRSHFPSCLARARLIRRAGPPAIAGEASPYYLCHPGAPSRATAAVGQARLVLLLRNPLDRTFSHYREQRRNGVEPLNFDDAVAAEAGRLADARHVSGPNFAETFAYEHQSYVWQSEYAPAVARWLAAFPSQQLLVLRSEDFYADPQATYDVTLSFLGLPPHRLSVVPTWNAAPMTAMSTATRQRLRAHFDPLNAELEALLGRDFGWAG